MGSFEEILISLATKEGIFALMFVGLFLYQIYDSRNREKRLMDFISEITRQFETLARQYEKLAEDVDEIRIDLKEIFYKNRGGM